MEDIFSKLGYFLAFSKILGLFPLTLKKESKKFVLKTTFAHKVYTLICFLAFVFIFGSTINATKDSFAQKNNYRGVWYILLVLGYGNAIANFIYLLVKLKKSQEFYKLISPCDAVFRAMDRTELFKKENIYINGICFISLSIATVYTALNLLEIDDIENFKIDLYYCGLLFLEIYFTLIFVLPGFIVLRRLLLANKLLR